MSAFESIDGNDRRAADVSGVCDDAKHAFARLRRCF